MHRAVSPKETQPPSFATESSGYVPPGALQGRDSFPVPTPPPPQALTALLMPLNTPLHRGTSHIRNSPPPPGLP